MWRDNFFFTYINCQFTKQNLTQFVHTSGGSEIRNKTRNKWCARAACACWIKELDYISRCNSTSVCCETPLLLPAKWQGKSALQEMSHHRRAVNDFCRFLGGARMAACHSRNDELSPPPLKTESYSSERGNWLKNVERRWLWIVSPAANTSPQGLKVQTLSCIAMDI